MKRKLFTSLSGTDSHKLLETLPEKLNNQVTCAEIWRHLVMFLWKTLLDMLTHFERDVVGMCVMQNTRAFLSTFAQLGNTKRKGYGKDGVAPYIHIYAHHAPVKNTQFKCLGWFSSQGLEKKNDKLKTLHHARSNK